MTRLLLLAGALFVFATHGPGPAAAQVTARITVSVPHEATELAVDGKLVPGTGMSRQIDLPPLGRGQTARLTFTATWHPNGYTTITRSKTVTVRAGERPFVDLTLEDPNDRVKVRYVPTPEDIADAMIKLAGITPKDVVYEPGCGNARITIAAVNAGARKGVGIDIDPERVAESRANVKKAGLENKVEIRLGDALDIKDLSEASVVLLYMGDHFNLLLRPHLWRELKVGARVVSHRFTMGDWKPDKTVSVDGYESSEYELHLWTITEELKRKLTGQ